MSKANRKAITTAVAIELTRRSTLGALVASAAMVSPAVAADACIFDPIFPLIETHRQARAAWLASLENEPSTNDQPAHDAWERGTYGPSDAEQEATVALLTTAPTTLAGALALLRYIEETDTDGEVYRHTHCDDNNAFGALVGSLIVALAPLVRQ